jgi:hypothetical protein
MIKWIVLIALLVLLAIPTVVFAQDPSLVDSPVMVQPVTPAAPSPLAETLAWLSLVVSLWSAWSLAVMVGIDVVKARIEAAFTAFGVEVSTYPQVRALVTLIAVFVSAYALVQGGDYNIFTLAHAPAVVSNPDLQRLFTAVFMAVGAIALHDALKWRGQNSYIASAIELIEGDSD